jgi:hypothetical protein
MARSILRCARISPALALHGAGEATGVSWENSNRRRDSADRRVLLNQLAERLDAGVAAPPTWVVVPGPAPPTLTRWSRSGRREPTPLLGEAAVFLGCVTRLSRTSATERLARSRTALRSVGRRQRHDQVVGLRRAAIISGQPCTFQSASTAVSRGSPPGSPRPTLVPDPNSPWTVRSKGMSGLNWTPMR